ncbi:MAG TPA: SDR family NAD(P)-dependent oxidoreductase [Novosphingobium sp.]|nr:SDR family NAD(P)-dependent oxidoreductase [Novosphingobium sp.]
MRGLKGKRIIVAGSATGIGAATARRLGAEGAHILMGDVDADKAGEIAAQIAAAGGTASATHFNLHDEATMVALIDKAVKDLGGLDGLVNVAYEGRAEYHGRDFTITEMDPHVWETVLHANVIGTGLMMKHAIPHMIEAGGGSIVNITSGASRAAEPIRVVYAASKAGINSITRHVAGNYGVHKIRANCVSPGAILTEAGQAAFSDEMRTAFLKGMPIKRLGEPEDIASTIAYLQSDDTDWVTGQVWTVDGGMHFRD